MVNLEVGEARVLGDPTGRDPERRWLRDLSAFHGLGQGAIGDWLI
jgi:hypothetical protein